MSTQTAVGGVSRRSLRPPAERGVLAAWAAAAVGAFALAWVAGWATGGERAQGAPVAAIPIQPAVVASPALEPATPLPALRPVPVRRKPRERPRLAPAPPRAPVVSAPPAPRRSAPAVARRPVAPPPPTPVVIVGKG